MVIELRPPVSESSTESQHFMPTTNSEHKSRKMEIENWLLIGFNLGLFWLGTRTHNHNIMFKH